MLTLARIGRIDLLSTFSVPIKIVDQVIYEIIKPENAGCTPEGRPSLEHDRMAALYREGLLSEVLDLVEQINSTRKTPMVPYEKVGLTKKLRSTWLRRSFGR